MKVLYSWLKDYIDINLSAQEIAQKLTSLGMEVESYTQMGADFEGVSAAKIERIDQHPNADKLHLVTLATGWGKQQVVCGAQNIAEGQTVPLAKIGARLGKTILQPANIRGVVSEGMLCSADELGLAAERQKGILILDDNLPIGADVRTLYGEPDVLFEVEITPNRGDLLSHLGIARELSILLNLPLKEAPALPYTIKGDDTLEITLPAGEQGCPRYNGRIIKNVKNGESPDWLKKRLLAMDVNPKNALVDITNYVLFAIGHPLHAFDLNHIEGGKITARRAEEGEQFTGLNGNTYTLNEQNLVIADGVKSVALAGILGGKGDSINEDTTSIVLEAAYFYPPAVNKTAKKLGISTEASQRFERGTDINNCVRAMELATGLVAQICGGEVQKTNDAYYPKYEPKEITFTAKEINDILGIEVPAQKMKQIFNRLGQFDGSGEVWTFLPPTHRRDITHKWDLAEEVARFAGYAMLDEQQSDFTKATVYFGENPKAVDIGEIMQNALTGIGFFECKNFDFVSAKDLKNFNCDEKNAIEIANPLAEGMEFLRPSLLIGLLKNIAYNQSFNNNDLYLYEYAKTFALQKGYPTEYFGLAGVVTGKAPKSKYFAKQSAPVDFYFIKGAVEAALSKFDGIKIEPSKNPAPYMHPKICVDIIYDGKVIGLAGQLHPLTLKAYDIKTPVFAFEFTVKNLEKHFDAQQFKHVKETNIYPSSLRDLSLVIDKKVTFEQIRKELEKLGNTDNYKLIDLYQGANLPEGKKSITLHFEFSAPDHTLKDGEVNAKTDAVLAALKTAFGASLRA